MDDEKLKQTTGLDLNSYKTLNHARIAPILRDAIRALHQSHDGKAVHYRDIAEKICEAGKRLKDGEIEISEDALKTFSTRDYQQRVNANNKTVRCLYLYFMRCLHELRDDVRSILVSQENWPILTGRTIESQHDDHRQILHAIQLAATMFYTWCHFGSQEVARTLSKFSKEYVLLRKSVANSNQIVKSKLSIELDRTAKRILQASHIHTDRHGVTRHSTGFVISVVRNIYLIFQVEDGEGLEIIALREPVQKRYLKMMGFMLSINADRKILSARVFLEREDDVWRSMKPRFLLSDLADHPERQEFVAKLLDQETAQTIPDIVLTDVFH